MKARDCLTIAALLLLICAAYVVAQNADTEAALRETAALASGAP